jgi:magnesium-transporting ATPase (P-type)
VYVLECRSLVASVRAVGLWTNPWVYAGIGALVALQLLFVYAPPLQRLLHSAPLPADAWGRAALAALAVVPVVAAEKWWRRRRAPAAA